MGIKKNKIYFISSILLFITIQAKDKITWTPGEVTIDNHCVVETMEEIQKRSNLNLTHEIFKGPKLSGINFLATDSVQTNPSFTYADTSGAIGPKQFLLAMDQLVKSFNKLTGFADNNLNININFFFDSVRGNKAVVNPRLRYDRFVDRWYISAINLDISSLNNNILLAVSDSGVITSATAWSFYAIKPGNFVIQGTLAVDKNALYLGGQFFESFTSPAKELKPKLLVVNKAKLLQGTLFITKFSNLVETEVSQGSDNLDTNATLGYTISMSNIGFNLLEIRIITNPGSSNPANPPTISNFINIPIATIAKPILVNHKGNNSPTMGKLFQFDQRLANAVIRNNKMWTVQCIGLNNLGTSTGTITRNGIRWYQIDLTNFSTMTRVPASATLFTKSATNDVNQLNYWVPSIMNSGQGNILIGCTTAGTNAFVNALAAVRLITDPASTFRLLPYTNSTTAYNPSTLSSSGRPWGIWSQTSLDPCDNMTMWTVQEYCSNPNVAGIRVVSVLAPLPAQPISTTPSTIPRGQTNFKVTVKGQQIDGSGFFDPGPSFPCRLRASINTGIIVKNVQYVNPTTIILTLDTTAALPGNKNLTVTNPDGQVRVGPGLIKIV